MTRVNFNKDVKMHLACNKDDLSPVLSFIFFKDGFAYATDGNILVKNKLEEFCNAENTDLLEGKLLHCDSYKEILKYEIIQIAEDGIECVDKHNEKAFFYFSSSECMYPNADKALMDARLKPSVPLPQISINLNFIERLRCALCSGLECKFTFKGINEPVILESLEMQSVGLIMPLYSEQL